MINAPDYDGIGEVEQLEDFQKSLDVRGTWTLSEIDILIRLAQKDMSVSDIEIAINRSSSAVCHKLNQLKKGLVIEGTYIMYPFDIQKVNT